jgi:frataxin
LFPSNTARGISASVKGRYPYTSLTSRPILSLNDAFIQQLRAQRRYFETEYAYHNVADETLDEIQDVVETALEDHIEDGTYEVVLASGVLTMTLPPHGTWVLNKQTPNRQIWWSSPLSGPRRYEYDDDVNEWVFTRDDSHSMTLKQAMKDEFEKIYGVKLDL